MRAKALLALLSVTALGAYAAGRLSHPVHGASIAASAQPAPTKTAAPKATKVKATNRE
jgi:hypothetical protein